LFFYILYKFFYNLFNYNDKINAIKKEFIKNIKEQFLLFGFNHKLHHELMLYTIKNNKNKNENVSDIFNRIKPKYSNKYYMFGKKKCSDDLKKTSNINNFLNSLLYEYDIYDMFEVLVSNYNKMDNKVKKKIYNYKQNPLKNNITNPFYNLHNGKSLNNFTRYFLSRLQLIFKYNCDYYRFEENYYNVINTLYKIFN